MAALSLLAALCLSGPQVPTLENYNSESLRNLKAVYVKVAESRKDVFFPGEIKTEVELLLRQNGVPIADKDKTPTEIDPRGLTPRRSPLLGIVPMLEVSVTTIGSDLKVGSITVKATSYQLARNNPKVAGTFLYWEDGALFSDAEATFHASLMEALAAVVKGFCNDWLAAHPSK